MESKNVKKKKIAVLHKYLGKQSACEVLFNVVKSINEMIKSEKYDRDK